MANQIAKTTGFVVKETAKGYYNSRLFSGIVSKKYEGEFADEGNKKGDTIYIRKPAKFRVRSGANQEIQSVNETKIAVVLPAQVGVDYSFSSRELTLDIDKGRSDDLQGAGSAIASAKDAEGLQLAAINAGFTVITTATPALSDFTKAKSMLNKQLAPKGSADRYAFVGSDVESAIANEVKVLYNSSAEISKAIKENELSTMGGVTFASTDLAFVRTNGAGGTVVTLGAVITPDYVNETQTITIAGAGAASVAVGDTMEFAGAYFVNPETKQVYVNKLQRKVLSKPTATTAVVYAIRPVISAPATADARGQAAMANCDALPANGSTITILGVAGTKYLCSPVMHKDAVVLTSVPMIKPTKVEMVDSVTVDGMSIRFIKNYSIDGDTMPSRLDTLSVFTAIYPEWIVSVETPLA